MVRCQPRTIASPNSPIIRMMASAFDQGMPWAAMSAGDALPEPATSHSDALRVAEPQHIRTD